VAPAHSFKLDSCKAGLQGFALGLQELLLERQPCLCEDIDRDTSQASCMSGNK
jgi:hypothetical protein